MEELTGKQNHRRDQAIIAGCAILIISDTRTKESDESGKLIKKLLQDAGHAIIAHNIIKNEKKEIQTTVLNLLRDHAIQVIITSGGTGISTRDVTVDALSELFEKTLIGFGEFFRRISWKEIGEAAMLSRATGGIIDKRAIFCLPGSKNAVELALSKIIIPCLGHLLWEAKR